MKQSFLLNFFFLPCFFRTGSVPKRSKRYKEWPRLETCIIPAQRSDIDLPQCNLCPLGYHSSRARYQFCAMLALKLEKTFTAVLPIWLRTKEKISTTPVPQAPTYTGVVSALTTRLILNRIGDEISTMLAPWSATDRNWHVSCVLPLPLVEIRQEHYTDVDLH